MSTFPRSPKLLNCDIGVDDPANRLVQQILRQENDPDSLTGSWKAKGVSAQDDIYE